MELSPEAHHYPIALVDFCRTDIDDQDTLRNFSGFSVGGGQVYFQIFMIFFKSSR